MIVANEDGRGLSKYWDYAGLMFAFYRRPPCRSWGVTAHGPKGTRWLGRLSDTRIERLKSEIKEIVKKGDLDDLGANLQGKTRSINSSN